jgi:antitoxin component YwqK of YwqJK toxin-antitoxin module
MSFIQEKWTNIDGVKNGSITCYHKDGTLHFTENWVNGQEHGYFEYNWSNGKPFYKGHYIYGERHGWWEDYWHDGREKYKGYYDMGQKTWNKTDVRDKLIEITLGE